MTEACLLAANSLLQLLLPAPVTELLDSPGRRGLVVQQARLWKARGVSFGVFAGFLALSTKTLRRWMQRCDEHGGQEVLFRSRKPRRSPGRLPVKIQDALWRLRRAMPECTVAELSRMFHNKFRHLLDEHGVSSISPKTVGRYVGDQRPTTGRSTPTAGAHDSARGEYRYPPALAMAWIDTTHLKVAGIRIDIIAAMEASSRIVVSGEVFVQENAQAVAEVLTATLSRVPELSGVLRDRGKPYLNAEINTLLGSQEVLPIDAHPYFPLDKAALERFWGTIKDWLRYALSPFEQRCRSEGRTPCVAEVVTVVQPALRACLRAYNLLPQPYLENNSPIERIDALLRGHAEPGFTLSDLRRLAIERDTKDDLLIQLRDGLQIAKNLPQMRHDFAAISRTAILHTFEAVEKKLIVTRDAAIRSPYRYFLAVARMKEREHQKHCAQIKKIKQDEQARRARDTEHELAIQSEQQQREEHPESCLATDLEAWAKALIHPVKSVVLWPARTLRTTLAGLKAKLGNAFAAQIEAASETLATIAERIRPDDPQLPAQLQAGFQTLLAKANRAQNATRAGRSKTAPRSSSHNPVRGFPRDPP